MYTGPVHLAVTEEHAACLGMLALPPLEIMIIVVVVIIIVVMMIITIMMMTLSSS